jgi:hypothetical protein
MLFGFCPFEATSIAKLIDILKEDEVIVRRDINPITDYCEKLIKKMLVKNQEQRISWEELFAMFPDNVPSFNYSGYNSTATQSFNNLISQTNQLCTPLPLNGANLGSK